MSVFKINPNTKLPAEQRELAYSQMRIKPDGSPVIEWCGAWLTVDQANKLYSAYTAEDDSRAAEIQILIKSSKAYIRELYPDK